jgi:hypothetical protein
MASLVKTQHRPIDLQRPMVDGRRLYQSVCWCGRKATVGSRMVTQMDQKAHRRDEYMRLRSES